MFTKERLTLTGWYLAIIMLISMIFSLFIYRGLTQEIDRALRAQRYRLENPDEFPRLLPPQPNSPFQYFLAPLPGGGYRIGRAPDPELLEDAKNRIKYALLLVNVGILVFSGGAGYFLAGKTLKPIAEMIDEQNRFIADSSHELRTPITALKTSIEVSLRDKGLSLSQAKDLLKNSLGDINHLQLLSDNLIQLASYQKGSIRRIFEPVDLTRVLEQAKNRVQVLAKERVITITLPVKTGVVIGNERRLTDLFVIFLDNAIKYSPAQTEIKITSRHSDHCVVVQIKDQGIGIAREDLPRIFDRFYRADKSRSKAMVSGYGLGLAIAKQIIDEHHGSIKVTSQIGKGTVFAIRLPERQ